MPKDNSRGENDFCLSSEGLAERFVRKKDELDLAEHRADASVNN